jgi:nitroreductase
MNPKIISQAIRNRRSMFPAQYTDEKVDDELIHELLENANWAPTHKLTQPWKFKVFTGEGLKKLANFQAELYREVSAAKGTFNENTYQKLMENPLKASHIISIGMQRDEKESVPEMEEIAAVACAVQNMYISACAYGLGVYWGSGGVTYYPEAKAFFGLGEKDKLMGFFYIGVPREGLNPIGRRNPIEYKVEWIRH